VDHVRELVTRHFGERGGELLVGGIPIRALAEKHGTPLFVYDAGTLDRQFDRLRSAYPAPFEIFYSVKANPCPSVLRHFVGRGLGLEIASAGEFHQALHAGCAPGRILFAGPGKTERELAYVLERGIGEIHVESALEGKRVASISRRLGIKAHVALRINPGAEAQGGAMRMGGKPAPFGVDEERLDDVLDGLLAEPSLDVQGIHLFTGTQILDDRILVTQYRRGLEIARRAADRMGRPLRTLDFGGGLGIPYFANETPLPLESLAEGLAELISEIRGDARFQGTRFIIEPHVRFQGQAGEQATFFFLDPSGNALEFKAFADLGQLFARQ